MDQYIVSARKYRPATFSTVVGQKALTATLKTAISTGRLAHAYLFCGPRGVGKTSCARIFAKTINCEHPTPDGNPCNECDSCRAFNENRSLNILELDAASNNSVDDIRKLTDQVQVPPSTGRYRVFIIDEVHMLTTQAFNAFLKTLEEPPSYAVFVLATTEKHKIIPTILSRCQIYDFNRITIADMVDHLAYVASQEGIEADRAALRVIATKADGAMRDALSIFDQVAASTKGHVTYEATIDNLNMLDSAIYNRLVDAFVKQDVAEALLIYKEVRDRGFDSHFFINGLAEHLRDLMAARDERTLSLLDYDGATVDALHKQAQKCEPIFFYQAMNLCNSADLNYRSATNKTFLVELLLIRLCQLLSPSPNYSGVGEGRLQPIATTQQAPASQGQPAQAQTMRSDTPKPQAQPQAQAQTAAAGASAAPSPQPRAKASTQAATHRPKLSLRGLTDTGAMPTEHRQQASIANRSGAYTPEQVVDAWRAYLNAHPTEHILINTMRQSLPVAGESPGQFIVTVQNELQVDTLGARMHEITNHCRDSVGNDSITFTIDISREGAKPFAWTDRQVFEHLLKDDEIRDFVSRLNLTLL